MKYRAVPAYLFGVLWLGACQPENSPVMSPGADCLSCHASNNSRIWTLAGTVFNDPNADPTGGVQGAQVLVQDKNGKLLTLNTNEAGNFYTAEALQFPVHVEVQKNGVRMAMDDTPEIGACNTCHDVPPQNGAIGRIFVPDGSGGGATPTQ